MTAVDPIVLVPGFMGSRLRRRNDRRVVWIDLGWTPFHVAELLHDLDLTASPAGALEPVGALDEIPFEGIIHYRVYQGMRDWALASSSYGLGLSPSSFHEFGYDWRLSVDDAAAMLDGFLATLGGTRKVTLIAHSQGGLVAARLLDAGGAGSQRVARLVAIGCPFAGLLKTIDMIERGSGVLDLFFPKDPIRALLRAMPATYELMPSRTAPVLFRDTIGSATTPYGCPKSFPAARYDPALLSAAGATMTGLRLAFPVPLRRIEGYGTQTAVSGSVGAAGITVDRGIEGDGTCPSASLGAATGANGPGGVPGVRSFSVPFGSHVPLVQDTEILAYLKVELTPGMAHTSRIAARVLHPLWGAGQRNLLIVETRDPDGEPLPGGAAPIAVLPDHAEIPLAPCPLAGPARWIGWFEHPSVKGPLVVTVPGEGRTSVFLG